ncbi:MAG: STAS domain-containing protein [Fibrobacterales bacterium]
MSFERSLKGPYACFKLEGDFTAGQIVKLKNALNDDILDGKKDIALDVRDVSTVDVTGMRFLENLREALKKQSHELVLYGANPDVEDKAEASKITIYTSQADFERGFHEMSVKSIEHYLELSGGDGQVRSLNLECPLCGYEKIKGFMLDESVHELTWVDGSITPEWRFSGNSENEIDYDLYSVAVCSNCFFASHRADWFNMSVLEGKVESVLTQDQKDRIANHNNQRKEIGLGIPSIRDPMFFAMPRERQAAYAAWKLNEITLRTEGKEKGDLDGFEIAVCNFMMCKFGDKPEDVPTQLNTAMAWLLSILEHKNRYSTLRIVKTYVYCISVELGMGRLKNAEGYLRDFEEHYQNDDECKMWLLRARELIHEEKEDSNRL